MPVHTLAVVINASDMMAPGKPHHETAKRSHNSRVRKTPPIDIFTGENCDVLYGRIGCQLFSWRLIGIDRVRTKSCCSWQDTSGRQLYKNGTYWMEHRSPPLLWQLKRRRTVYAQGEMSWQHRTFDTQSKPPENQYQILSTDWNKSFVGLMVKNRCQEKLKTSCCMNCKMAWVMYLSEHQQFEEHSHIKIVCSC